MPRIAICICTYQRRELLIRALYAVLKADVPPGTEIVVVDNDPRGEPPILGGLDIRYVREPRRGVAFARNRAVISTNSDFIAFIDDDDTVKPDWLVRLLERQRETGADIVFGSWSDNVLPITDKHPESPENLERAMRLWGVELPSNMATCNALISRRAFRLVDQPPFSRNFAHGGEDTEFFIRAAKAGATWATAPNSLINKDTSERATVLRMIRHGFVQGRNGRRMVCLHGQPAVAGARRRDSAAKLAKTFYRQAWKKRKRLPRYKFAHRVGYHLGMLCGAADHDQKLGGITKTPMATTP